MVSLARRRQFARTAVGKIDRLFTGDVPAENRNGRPGADFVSLPYRNSADTISATLTYQLTGGSFNSNTSMLAQTFEIKNTGSTVLDFHLFERKDTEHGLTFADAPRNTFATAQRTNANTFIDCCPYGTIHQKVLSLAPDRWDIDKQGLIANALIDNLPTNLDRTPESMALLGQYPSYGLQWDLTLPPGGSITLKNDLMIQPVPEATSLLLFASGLGFLLVLSRSWRSREGGRSLCNRVP